jgi:hypothetical protein
MFGQRRDDALLLPIELAAVVLGMIEFRESAGQKSMATTTSPPVSSSYAYKICQRSERNQL